MIGRDNRGEFGGEHIYQWPASATDAIDIWGISSAFTNHEFRFAEKFPNQLP